ncbi:VOC family protein [Sphingobacterium thalpophilum]|uniref:VOC family protein n=1 Tax=Sphingobacterium thalpophilum TaxID=259 RepID=UPI003DA35E6C
MEGLKSGVFITFSGNCRKALTFYQTCFGGTLEFHMFGQAVDGNSEVPVVSASLIAPGVIIYGSDLVHDEGRKIGNYVSMFLTCPDAARRRMLMAKLARPERPPSADKLHDKLLEVVDPFDVRWILSI